MENIRSQGRISGKIITKEPPIISSRLPAAFGKFPIKAKPRMLEQKCQQITSAHRLKRVNSITQEDLNRFEEQAEYKKASKLLTPINVDSKRKARMEKVLSKIMQGLPNFSFNIGDQEKRKNINRNSQQELKALKSSNIQLSQIITLSVKSGQSGVIKKVLHGPSLKLYAIKEVPLHTRETRIKIRDWLCFWQKLNERSDQKHQPLFIKIHGIFWNSPEGAASLITDTVAFSLKDLIQNIGVLPLKCIQKVTQQILKGFKILNSEDKQYEGLQSSQILITKTGQILLSFGIKQKILKSNNVTTSQQFTTLLNNQNEKEIEYQLLNRNKNQDILDLGLLLLQSAIGDEEIVQNSINELISSKVQVRCCLFHQLVSNCKIIELLISKFPLQFKDFLCKCFTFNDELDCKKKIEQLLNHEFLTLRNFNNEPQVELTDLVRITLGYNQNSANFANEQQLDRIIEAIGIVVGRLEISANQQSYFNKRISDLANELALPVENVQSKIKSILKLRY